VTSCGEVGCGTEARTNHVHRVAFLAFSKKRMLCNCKWASGLPKPFYRNRTYAVPHVGHERWLNGGRKENVPFAKSIWSK
jgi:hypothetical protein